MNATEILGLNQKKEADLNQCLWAGEILYVNFATVPSILVAKGDER